MSKTKNFKYFLLENILKVKNLLQILKSIYFRKLFFIPLLVFTSSIFSPLAGSQNSGDKTNICFFELDNTQTSRNFKSQLSGKKETGCPSKWESSDTTVYCYQAQIGENERGGQAFERMIKEMSDNNEKCDSLVISGHHTGNWQGKTGKLKLKTMEALSCNPKYKDWFDNIKALWLDGCNTVTDNFIQSRGIVQTSDSETVRVVAKDKTDTGLLKLDRSDVNSYQQAYTGSLDENTPLSSRYLRMFPNTQIYGVNGATSTAKQKGNDSYIYQHLTQLGKALKGEEQDLQNKEQESNTRENFNRGFQALFSNDDFCDPEKLEAWENVPGLQAKQIRAEAIENQDYKKAYKLGCDLILAKQVLDNPRSTEAQKALALQIKNDPQYRNKTNILRLANQILETPGSSKANQAVNLAQLSIVQSLKTINREDQNVTEQDKTYSHLLFNNIYDSWNTAKKYKSKNVNFFRQVKSELQHSSFKSSLKERIQSSYTASLKKGDYIKLYTEVNDINKGNFPAFIKTELNNLIEKAMTNFEGLKSPRDTNLKPEIKRILSISVVDQMFQYDFLTKQQIEVILKNENLFPPNTRNYFIRDTQLRLAFHNEPENILPRLEQEENPFMRKGIIRVSTEIYLNQFSNKNNNNARQQLAKENLQKIVQKINFANVQEDTGSGVFFQSLYDHIKTQYSQNEQKQVDFLLDFSSDGSRTIQEIAVLYAADNLKNKSAQENFCKRIADLKYKYEPNYCD